MRSGATPVQSRKRTRANQTMGEHDTWWNFLGYIPGWDGFAHNAQEQLGRKWVWGPFGALLAVPLLIIGMVALQHAFPANAKLPD